MVRVVFIAAAASIVCASPGIADEIKPEMIVAFSNGALACLERDHLQEITEHALRGEATKAEAMMVENGGDCFMISASKKVKVLSVEYNNTDLDIGLLEVVGDGAISLNGAWTYSVGAEEVKGMPHKHRN